MSANHRLRDQDTSFFLGVPVIMYYSLFSESSPERESLEKCALEVASEQFPSVDIVKELGVPLKRKFITTE